MCSDKARIMEVVRNDSRCPSSIILMALQNSIKSPTLSIEEGTASRAQTGCQSVSSHAVCHVFSPHPSAGPVKEALALLVRASG